MIAEVHGKISSSGSNLSDRLEDKLTGDVFGALRYLPFRMGIAQILCAANIDNLTKRVMETDLCFWGDRLRFWPFHEEGEIDAFLELDNAVVGIEVKYNSDISSDDEVDNSRADIEAEKEESCHQLARESRIVKSWCPANKKAFLLFIAKENVCAAVCENVKSRNILEPGVELGYLSWQEILSQMKKVDVQEPWQKVIRDDIVALLTRKKFERFEGFTSIEDVMVTANEYYDYGNITNRQMRNAFTFNYEDTINGGDYYEYR